MVDDETVNGQDQDPSSSPDPNFESLLRKAARASEQPAVRLPRRGEILAGKYRIEQLIGRGGMGAVFRAAHLVSEKSVAIKWMLRSPSDEQARRRFEREARLTGRIDHPNVVDVYDIGQEGDGSYLVMELLHGEALRERLARGLPTVAESIDLLLPAMRGVAAAHKAGVIHRDLKPDNIFLCQGPDGSPREAKVLDFGISALLTKADQDSTITTEGTVIGTPAYMSPEQLHNSHLVDARTDVYSFGVILYEALCGVLPLTAESPIALILAIATTRPKSLTDIRPELSPQLARIVERALEKRPEDRYASIDDLVEALLPFASVRSGQASGSTNRSPAIPARNRNRLVGSLAAAAVASLALAAWLHAKGTDPSTAQRATTTTNAAVTSRPPAKPASPGDGALDAQTSQAVDASLATERTVTTSRSTTTATPLKPKRRPNPGVQSAREAAPEHQSAKRRAGTISVDQL